MTRKPQQNLSMLCKTHDWHDSSDLWLAAPTPKSCPPRYCEMAEVKVEKKEEEGSGEETEVAKAKGLRDQIWEQFQKVGRKKFSKNVQQMCPCKLNGNKLAMNTEMSCLFQFSFPGSGHSDFQYGGLAEPTLC